MAYLSTLLAPKITVYYTTGYVTERDPVSKKPFSINA